MKINLNEVVIKESDKEKLNGNGTNEKPVINEEKPEKGKEVINE